MEKTISVTLTLDKNGAAIDFYEGDCRECPWFGVCAAMDDETD